MNKKYLAQLLNGRQIGKEISKQEASDACDAGLVVIYGASDDLIEIEGAISDEVCSFDGQTWALFHKGELYQSSCESEDCPHELAIQEKCHTVKAIFGGDDFTWTYETKIPHETFEIFEDGDKFCRGIVFSIDDIQ